MGSTKDELTFDKEVSDGWCVPVPAGTWHNITNIGEEPMQVYAIHAPAHHKPGKIHDTASAAAADMDDAGVISVLRRSSSPSLATIAHALSAFLRAEQQSQKSRAAAPTRHSQYCGRVALAPAAANGTLDELTRFNEGIDQALTESLVRFNYVDTEPASWPRPGCTSLWDRKAYAALFASNPHRTMHDLRACLPRDAPHGRRPQSCERSSSARLS